MKELNAERKRLFFQIRFYFLLFHSIYVGFLWIYTVWIKLDKNNPHLLIPTDPLSNLISLNSLHHPLPPFLRLIKNPGH